LRRSETIEASIVGGSVVVGLALLCAGFAFGISSALPLGGALALGAIPWSMVFTNGSRVGAILFGAVGITVWLGAACALAAEFFRIKPLGEAGLALLGAGVMGVIVSTWLSGIPALRRHR
jgi:hypothetical protein